MLKRIIVLMFVALVSACAVNQQASLPAVSSDGLHLVPDTKLGAVYLKPGADLSQYNKLALLDTYVSFAKNWQRNYNEEATFEDQVSDKEMQKIRNKVSEGFAEELTKTLTADGRQFVKTGGTGVLILRPAIINLRITAPDLMTPGMEQTFVASTGSMTLYLELLDGKTGDLIARIIDSEAASDDGIAEVANSVTNTADFDRVVQRWAQLLNAHLKRLTAKS
ncbi:Uncharacterised protein [Halioglobus japonicus]|nr:Uncharacterised protein [Halioglobus japonicus]